MTTSRNRPQLSLRNVFLPILLILLIIIGSLYFIKSQLRSKGNETSVGTRPAVGQVLPNFILNGIESDKDTGISEIHAKIILMNFWATWCEACMVEMPSLVKLHSKFKSRGFEIIGINLDESPSVVVPRVKKRYQIEFPIFEDKESKIVDLFDIHAIPLTVVLNDKREVLLIKDGEENWNSPRVHQQVEQWLSE